MLGDTCFGVAVAHSMYCSISSDACRRDAGFTVQPRSCKYAICTSKCISWVKSKDMLRMLQDLWYWKMAWGFKQLEEEIQETDVRGHLFWGWSSISHRSFTALVLKMFLQTNWWQKLWISNSEAQKVYTPSKQFHQVKQSLRIWKYVHGVPVAQLEVVHALQVVVGPTLLPDPGRKLHLVLLLEKLFTESWLLCKAMKCCKSKE